MTPQEQIKALAELDGLWPLRSSTSMERQDEVCNFPNYLTSYDAIIPLIQKQTIFVINEVECQLYDMNNDLLKSTPAQLCEALLRATGKWQE